MFKLWLEWDYGQDDLIFTSRDDAVRWMNGNIDYQDFDPPFRDADAIFEEGLAGMREVEVYVPGK